MTPPIRMLLLWAVLQPVAMAGAPAAAAPFANLAGEWQGSGEINGMASVQQMHWEPVLNGRFLRLTLDNRMTAADGVERRFQAQAFYRAGDDGAIAGTWFDSRGISLPLVGSIDDQGVMTILWGTDDTERGRSSYRIVADTLAVTDEVLTPAGAWRVFGRAKLSRTPR